MSRVVSSALAEEKDVLIRKANEVLAQNGFDYKADMFLTEEYFTTREYENFTLPAGEYLALRVLIGEAEGQNWWCVLYPPLCFVDSTYSVVPDETKNRFSEVLSSEAYNAITIDDIKDNTYEFRFRFLTFLNR